MRTGPLPTMSDLFDYWRYLNSLELQQHFSIIIDDKVFEEPSAKMESNALYLALGLGCEFLHVKGIAKPER